jgi:hypothetical protein
LVTFSVTEAEPIFEPAGIVERSHVSRADLSLPVPAGSSPSTPRGVAVPWLFLGAFSRMYASAMLVTDAVLVVATAQVRSAGAASVLPALSVAFTENV